MTTVRKTVSMEEQVFDKARAKMKELGYKEFSDYVQGLIRADTGFQPLREQPVEYKVTQKPPRKRKPKPASSPSPSAGGQEALDVIKSGQIAPSGDEPSHKH